MTRARPGDGTVFRDGRGRWGAAVRLPPTPARRRPRWYLRLPRDRRNTEAEAHRLRREMLAAVAAGDYPGARPAVAAPPTVGDWLARWLAECVAPRGVAGTMRVRRQAVERLSPLIGHIPLPDLDAPAINAALVALAGRGLAPQTVNMARQALNVALNQAVAWSLLADNPCRLVRPPRVPRHQARVLSAEQAAAFVAAARVDWMGALCITALAVGVRRGEATGLRIDDVDPAARALTVARQVQWVSGVGAVVSDTKDHDRRTLTLPPALVATLADHLAERDRMRRHAGRRWSEQGWLFPSHRGTPLRPSSIQDGIARICRAAGVDPPVSLHELRHSCATLLLAQGVPVVAVVELLGHSGPMLVMRTYGHVIQPMRDQAAGVMEAVLRAPAPAVVAPMVATANGKPPKRPTKMG